LVAADAVKVVLTTSAAESTIFVVLNILHLQVLSFLTWCVSLIFQNKIFSTWRSRIAYHSAKMGRGARKIGKQLSDLYGEPRSAKLASFFHDFPPVMAKSTEA
jgi:hypothetical protein